ncbi:MAG: GGDEF domain-containing protein, partial [Pusillimonas sp.]
MNKRLFRIDLRRLILWMCLFFVLLALANSLFASYQVQRETLLQNTLSVNRVYAQKLAQITDSYIHQSRRALNATATEIKAGANNLETFQNELEHTARITPRFNSLFYSNASGLVLAAIPASDRLKGTTLVSRPSLEALSI